MSGIGCRGDAQLLQRNGHAAALQSAASSACTLARLRASPTSPVMLTDSAVGPPLSFGHGVATGNVQQRRARRKSGGSCTMPVMGTARCGA
jgi:hypothetical protein